MNIVDSKIDLRHGDCLEVMPTLEAGSIDMVLTDPPYGTTACKWDSIIPLEPMWENLKRLTKKNAAIVMTASQPFTTTLIASNMKMFKYCWVWDKVRGVGFQVAKYRPMMRTEDAVVFGEGRITYCPQMTKRDKIKKSKCYSSSDSNPLASNDGVAREYTHRHPTNIITASNASQKGKLHPTQKPVALMEYLIKTYTNEGDTVLDFTMGSGTTGVACKNLGRNFIGIEKDAEYFEIAKNRIQSTERTP